MARGPRLDAPGALHHVCARGIEKCVIFFDDADREDFLRRLSRLVEAGALSVYAWALMPNHIHLLVRTGNQPLHRSMRALLAGYATRFNRRHGRVGHLFQNRYRSTLCADESYFLTLVRYIHRNPVPGVLRRIEGLASYPFTGHSALLGRVERPWQDTAAVLSRFADDPGRARDLYAAFTIGEDDSREPDEIEGGGILQGRDGWFTVRKLQRGRERFTTHERILSGQPTAQRVAGELGAATIRPIELPCLMDLICRNTGITPEGLRGPGRTRSLSRARNGLAFLYTLHFGQSGRELARVLGITPSAVHQAARRGASAAEYWLSLLAREAQLK